MKIIFFIALGLLFACAEEPEQRGRSSKAKATTDTTGDDDTQSISDDEETDDGDSRSSRTISSPSSGDSDVAASDDLDPTTDDEEPIPLAGQRNPTVKTTPKDPVSTAGSSRTPTTTTSSCSSMKAAPSGSASSESSRGTSHPNKMNVCGTPVNLIGTGVRKRLGDRYILSAYSATKTCNFPKLIKANETKYMSIDVTRNTSANLVKSSIEDALADNMPEDADTKLKAQIEQTVEAFNVPFETGQKVEIFYTPEKGNVFRRPGAKDITIPGKEVMNIFWSAYFGDNSCCSNIKAEMTQGCED